MKVKIMNVITTDEFHMESPSPRIAVMTAFRLTHPSRNVPEVEEHKYTVACGEFTALKDKEYHEQ